MWTIGGKRLDLYDDLSGELIKGHIQKLGSIKVSSREELEKAKDTDFALSVLTKTGALVRKFPCTTAGDTLASMWYFEKTSSKLPDVYKQTAATFLKKASQKFNLIVPDCVMDNARNSIKSNEINEVEAPMVFSKTAGIQPDTDFALITRNDERRYPIDTPENTEKAAEYFEEYYKHFEPAYRAKMASAICVKANAFDIDVSKMHNLNAYNPTVYSNAIKVASIQRKEALPGDADSHRVLDQLMEKRASLKPIAFAEALERFDKMNGLDAYWDRGITDPYRVTFQHIKVATSVNFDGKAITLEKLAALASNKDVLQKHFDSNFISAFEKDAMAVFSSLPYPDKRLLVSLIDG